MRWHPKVTKRLTIALGTLIALGAVTFAMLAWMGTHPLLPGVGGCELVRQREARISCAAGYVLKDVRANGARATFAQLDTSSGIGRAAAECHDVGHVVAQRQLRRRDDPAAAYLNIRSAGICTQGYQHGVLFAAMKRDPDGYARLQRETCRGSASRKLEQVCNHGMGHALRIAGHSVELTRTFCIGLGRSRSLDCVQGLYMEEMERAAHAHPDAGTPPPLCQQVPVEDEHMCFTVLAGWFPLTRSPPPMEQRIQFCHDQPQTRLGVLGCISTVVSPIGISDVEACAALLDDELEANYCAWVTGQRPAHDNASERAGRRCTRIDRIAFGCVAGWGKQLADTQPVDRPFSWVRTQCARVYSDDASAVVACGAGAARCWPDLSPLRFETAVTGCAQFRVGERMHGTSPPE